MVDGLLTGRAASSGSILSVGGEVAGGTTFGTVDALADWVAGGLVREAAARLPGDGDGHYTTTPRLAMDSLMLKATTTTDSLTLKSYSDRLLQTL